MQASLGIFVMGLTKQYLRFIPGQVLNLVCHSSSSNCCFVSGKGRVTRFFAVAAAQNVVVWDLNTNTEACTIIGDQSEVTQLASWSNDLKNYLCVGYNDGTINVYDLAGETDGGAAFSVGAPVAFKGHRSGVTNFLFDPTGLFLVSGGKDSEIVVWDLVKESGLFRLKGHKGPITGLKFFPGFSNKSTDAEESDGAHVNDPEARLQRMQDLGSVLVSSAKDGMLKFWDLNTRHCCFTLAVPSAEIPCRFLYKTCVCVSDQVWDFEFLGQSWTKPNAVRFAVGSSTSDVVIWEASEPSNASDVPGAELEDRENGETSLSSDGIRFRCDKIGSVIRGTKGRTTGIKYLPKSRMLFISGQDKTIEAFRLSTEAECKKRVKKRLKKQAKQQGEEAIELPEGSQTELALSDQITRRTDSNVFASGRVKSFAVTDVAEKRKGSGGIRVVCGLANNQVESFSVDFDQQAEDKPGKKQKGQVRSVGKVEKPGHRSDVRVVDFSSDSTGLMSASAEALKIWARDEDDAWGCVRTIPCRYSVCGTFLPGDRHVVLGCRTGHVQLFDVAGGNLLEEVQTAEEGSAEGKAVCSICLSPNKKGFVTGSENKTVQFWDMEYVSEEGSKRLSFLHSRTLKMEESVLFVKFSPDGRLLAVACLDSTVKVFFADTLKFFVSLYGHKLPVLGMDISADSRLIATASSDRTIKIWGLDFGDCHRTLLGHADSVMAVKFLPPSTHHMMSAGRDGKVKYWDADSHQLISTMKGHLGEIWALATSPDGLAVATCSRDGSIRLWEKSQEIIVLDDERETEREEEENRELEAELAKEAANATSVVESNPEAGLAGLPSVGGEDACQRLMDALTAIQDILPEWRKAMKKAKPGQSLRSVGFEPHPKMMAYQTEEDPYGLLMETIARIPSSKLEECLTFLPYEYVRALVEILRVVIRRWRSFGSVQDETIKLDPDVVAVLDKASCVGGVKLKNYLEYAEAVLRTVFFLVRIQHGHIMADGNFLHSALAGLAEELSRWSEEANDLVGFNLAGLEALEHKIKERDAIDIFEEAFSRQKKKKKSQKRQRRLLEVEQALLSLT